jgi:hypothetical protein
MPERLSGANIGSVGGWLLLAKTVQNKELLTSLPRGRFSKDQHLTYHSYSMYSFDPIYGNCQIIGALSWRIQG